jgi:hypothetical protein
MAMSFRIACGVAAALALAAAGARADESADPLRLVHRVQADGEAFLVSAEGLARLPDGAVLQLRLVPCGDDDGAGDALRVARVDVRDGRFVLPPWSVPRAEVRGLDYRVEACLASEQPSQVERRLPRLAKRWRAASRLTLGDWRAVGARLVPVARALRERLTAVASHREELRRLALEACEGRLARSAWTGWRARSGFDRARESCLQALDAPLAAVVFPVARDRAYALVAQYDFAVAGVEKLLLSGADSKDDSVTEFVADFRVSPFTASPDDLLGLDAVLHVEGARHLVTGLDEVARLLDPDTKGAAARAPAAARGLRDILDWSRDFFALPVSAGAPEIRDGILRAVETAQRCLDAARPPSGPAADEAAAAAAGRVAWQELRALLTALREDLRKKIGG